MRNEGRALTEGIQPRKPYLGLVPYAEEDAQYFFGREREQKVIMANLMASRLTLLYGPSGVGKSSVLRAGVGFSLQKLSEQNIQELGTPEYIGISFSSWRDNPTTSLVNRVQDSVKRVLKNARVGRFLADDEKAIKVLASSDSAAPPQTLSESLQTLGQYADATLLITLDQFEEYFLYRGQHTEETSFANQLTQAVNTPNLCANFLISIREDALAKLDSFREDIPNLFDNYLRVDHLDYKSAKKAIEEPIKQYNVLNKLEQNRYEIEPELVDEVLAQVQTGQLLLASTGQGIIASKPKDARIETPYLQMVMTRLWDEEIKAQSHTLRLKTLQDLGNSKRIIETHLDASMGSLPTDQQKVAAKVFHYLVTPSGTKIAHTAADLAAYSDLRPEEPVPMLQKLSSGDARILRTVPPPPDQPNGDHRYEIFHDVLAAPILAWRDQFATGEKNAEARKIASKLLVESLSKLNEPELEIASRVLEVLVENNSPFITDGEVLALRGQVAVKEIYKVVGKLIARGVLRADPVIGRYYFRISSDLMAGVISTWLLSQRPRASHDVSGLENSLRPVKYVGTSGVTLTAAFHISLITLAIYSLTAFWRGTPSPHTYTLVNYFFATLWLSPPSGLLFVSGVAGVLAASLDGLYDFRRYVRNRVPQWRNILGYLIRPIWGGLLSLIVCNMVLAGLVSSTVESINLVFLFGVSMFVGKFSSAAFSKLVDTFQAVFRTPRTRKADALDNE